MVVRTVKDELERIDERVQQRRALETGRYKYLGKVMNLEGNLKKYGG